MIKLKHSHIPLSSRVWDFKKSGKQPNKIMTFVKLDDGLILNIHTDIVLYDFNENKVYKGDLV